MWKILDIVEIQRGVNQMPDKRLKAFVFSLEAHEIRWILTNFLQQFLPYIDPRFLTSRKQHFPSINTVHSQRLNNISNCDNNNHKDEPILLKMKEKFTFDLFYNPNSRHKTIPISINTINTSSNKCKLLKTIPQSLMSHIVSFLHCSERAVCCYVSYSMYQAANDNIGKNHLSFGSVRNDYYHDSCPSQITVDIKQLCGYNHVEFNATRFKDLQLNFRSDSFHQNFIKGIANLIEKVKKVCIKADLDDWRLTCGNVCKGILSILDSNYNDENQISSNDVEELSIIYKDWRKFRDWRDSDMIKYRIKINQANDICAIIANCRKLHRLTVNLNDNGDRDGSSSYLIDRFNKRILPNIVQYNNVILRNKILIHNIKYLDFDDRYNFDWPMNSHSNNNNDNNNNNGISDSALILYNIDEFVNIETLKLKLCFPVVIMKPGSIDDNKSGESSINYKDKLVKQADVSQIKLPLLTDRSKNKLINLACLRIIWYYVTTNNENKEYVVDGNVGFGNNEMLFINTWNEIMMAVIEYMFHLGCNIKQFDLSCPQLSPHLGQTTDNKIQLCKNDATKVIPRLLTFLNGTKTRKLELPIDSTFTTEVSNGLNSCVFTNLKDLSLVVELHHDVKMQLSMQNVVSIIEKTAKTQLESLR